jgi:carbonic anhydrase
MTEAAAAGGGGNSGPEVLATLLAGNRRFREGCPRHPHADPRRRGEVAAAQRPMAAVLGCADSRIPPEILFDRGLGDLFVVRVAGNVIGTLGLASLEYAVLHLGAPLIIVMGHSACGAITAAVDLPQSTPPVEAGANQATLLAALRPAVDAARAGSTAAGQELVDRAARAHARLVREAILARSPQIAQRQMAGSVLLVAAFYEMASGEVTLLD